MLIEHRVSRIDIRMHFLITAGGTREYIDPVRFISNASSGKMGYALARAALKAGHKVTLTTAPTALRPPNTARVVGVESAAEMFEVVKEHFRKCDCLIMAAAVADYAPVRSAKTKLKKTGQHLTIKLKPTEDILKWAGRHKKRHQIVVGFALEDKAVRARAEAKLAEKRLDMIVANPLAAIGAEKSTFQVKTPDGSWNKIQDVTKTAAARRIIHLIGDLAP